MSPTRIPPEEPNSSQYHITPDSPFGPFRQSPGEIIYDIETRTWAHEHPNEWNDIPYFGLAVACTWCECHGYHFFIYGDELHTHGAANALYNFLLKHSRIIGFNNLRFDNPIIANDAGRPVANLDIRSFDILQDIQARLGHRLKLEQLTEGTLSKLKSGAGIDAVAWWKQYEAYEALDSKNPVAALEYLHAIKNYCADDVKLTRDLYRFGQDHGFVRYMSRGCRYRVKVDWNPGAPAPELTVLVAEPIGEENIEI